MSFKTFTTHKFTTIINFEWNFVTVDGIFGVQIPISTQPLNERISTASFSTLYIKTFYYSNQTANGNQTNGNQTANGNQTNGNQTANGNQTNGNQTANGNQTNGNQTANGNQTNGNQTSNVEILSLEYVELQKFLITLRLSPVPLDPYLLFFYLNDSIELQYQVLWMEDGEAAFLLELTENLINFDILVEYHESQDNLTYSSSVSSLEELEDAEIQNKHEKQILQQVVFAATIMSWVIIGLALFVNKIIGLELAGLLQLAYLSLSHYDYFNFHTALLLRFRQITGFTVRIEGQNNKGLPWQIKQMGLDANFIRNCNLMPLSVFAVAILGFFLLALGRKACFPKFRKVGLIFLKPGLLTLILFTSLQTLFCVVVYGRYFKKDEEQQGLGSAFSEPLISLYLFAVAGVCAALIVTSRRHYKEFASSFKRGYIFQFYIVGTFCLKIALAVTLAAWSDESQKTLLITFAPIAFLFFFASNLPFKSVGHNFRAGLVHSTSVWIVYTANYYRNIADGADLRSKTRNLTASRIQVLLILTCILISLVMLLSQIAVNCQKRFQNRQRKRVRTQIIKTEAETKRVKTQNFPQIQETFQDFQIETIP